MGFSWNKYGMKNKNKTDHIRIIPGPRALHRTKYVLKSCHEIYDFQNVGIFWRNVVSVSPQVCGVAYHFILVLKNGNLWIIMNE